MVPTQFVLLFEHPDWNKYNLSSMRIWNSAGSPLRVETKRRIVEELPGELIELWGLTEGVATTLKPEDVLRKVAGDVPLEEFIRSQIAVESDHVAEIKELLDN